mgnify:CR=1 FL=1
MKLGQSSSLIIRQEKLRTLRIISQDPIIHILADLLPSNQPSTHPVHDSAGRIQFSQSATFVRSKGKTNYCP